MDFLSHLVMAYLILYAIGVRTDLMLATGILGAAIPDFDIFLIPLRKISPLFKHHGFMHSYLFMALFYPFVALYLVYMPHWNNFLIDYLLLLVGGTSHLIMDGLTDFSVKPFWPFSGMEISLNVERAVNFYILGISYAFTVMLVLFRIYNVSITYFYFMLSILYIIILGNYVLRVTILAYIKKGNDLYVEPTMSPFKWLIVKHESIDEGYTSTLFNFDLLRGKKSILKKLNIKSTNYSPLYKAIYKSYKLLKEKGMFEPSLFPYIVKSNGQETSVIWYYPSYAFRRFMMGIEVVFMKNGEINIKEIFRRT